MLIGLGSCKARVRELRAGEPVAAARCNACSARSKPQTAEVVAEQGQPARCDRHPPRGPSGMVVLGGRICWGFVCWLVLALRGRVALSAGLAIRKAHSAETRKLAALVSAAAFVKAQAQCLIAMSHAGDPAGLAAAACLSCLA